MEFPILTSALQQRHGRPAVIRTQRNGAMLVLVLIGLNMRLLLMIAGPLLPQIQQGKLV